MSAASISAVVLAGITFYVALHNLVVYLRGGRRYREHLTFALACLAMGLYDLFCAGLYNVTQEGQGQQWQRLQVVALALVSMTFPWFVVDYLSPSMPLERRWKVPLLGFTCYFALAAVLALVERGGLCWSDEPATKVIPLPWGGVITYYEVLPGPLTDVQSALGIGVFFYVLALALRAFWRGLRRETRPLLIALALFFLSALNDTAVSSGLYHFVYTMEYAYMGIVLLMTDSLTAKAVEAEVIREALQASEARFRSLVEATSDWIWEADNDLRFTYTSPRVQDILGYRPGDLLGRQAYDFMPAEDAASARTRFAPEIAAHKPLLRVENRFCHRDGHLVVLETSAVPILDGGRFRGYRGISRDVTERHIAEETLRRRAAQMEALRQVGLEITAQLDLDALLSSIVAHAVQLLGATGGGLYLYRPERDVLEWAIGVGEGQPAPGSVLRRGEGVSGHVWATGEPLIVDDYWHWRGYSRVHNGLPNVAVVAVPVHWGEEFLGVLSVGVEVELARTFSQADAEILSLFATDAAIAIRNARLYRAARRRAEYLAAVNHVAAAVGAALDLDDLLEKVYQEVAAIFRADSLFIALYDQAAGELDFRLLVDGGLRNPPVRQPLGVGLTSWVITADRPLLIRDMEREGHALPAPFLWGTMKPPASWLGVPMHVGQRLLGVICVQSYTPGAYDEEDKQLLCTLADQVAVAVERARLYETLHDSEEKYRALFEQANDAVLLLTLDGRILEGNRRLGELLGYEPAELLQRSVDELLPPEVRMRYSHTREGTDLGRTGMRVETWLLRRDGSRVAVELSTSMLEVGGQKMVLVLIRDITERQQLEEQLRQTQKMEAIGTLAGGLAHDFNNLLTGIVGYASLVQQDLPPDSQGYADVGAIIEAATRASDLTKQLLTVARMGPPGEMAPRNLNAIVLEVYRLLERTIDKAIVIELRLAEGLPLVHGDAGQLHQLLLNLCLNARDAMPRGGRMSIETAWTQMSAEAGAVLGVAAGDYVVLSVSDTGVGIEAEVRARLFEPFFTTKEQGRGLGLAMVYGIVRAHQGGIQVESAPGQGSTFRVYLPAHSANERVSVRESVELIGGSETVLVVDDEDSVRDVLQRILERGGYHVLLARDGQEAEEIFRQHADEIDLVILDMVMPRIGGKQTYERLRGYAPEVKVLLSSGYSEEGQAAEVLASGACGFLQKPYDVRAVLLKVRQALDQP